MTDIINLNQHRKAKAQALKEKTASENRRKFGRTKAEKHKEKLEAEKLKRHLEGHKLETEDDENS